MLHPAAAAESRVLRDAALEDRLSLYMYARACTHTSSMLHLNVCNVLCCLVQRGRILTSFSVSHHFVTPAAFEQPSVWC